MQEERSYPKHHSSLPQTTSNPTCGRPGSSCHRVLLLGTLDLFVEMSKGRGDPMKACVSEPSRKHARKPTVHRPSTKNATCPALLVPRYPRRPHSPSSLRGSQRPPLSDPQPAPVATGPFTSASLKPETIVGATWSPETRGEAGISRRRRRGCQKAPASTLSNSKSRDVRYGRGR